MTKEVSPPAAVHPSMLSPFWLQICIVLLLTVSGNCQVYPDVKYVHVVFMVGTFRFKGNRAAKQAFFFFLLVIVHRRILTWDSPISS